MGKHSSSAQRKAAAAKAKKQKQQAKTTKANDKVRALLKRALGSQEHN